MTTIKMENQYKNDEMLCIHISLIIQGVLTENKTEML